MLSCALDVTFLSDAVLCIRCCLPPASEVLGVCWNTVHVFHVVWMGSPRAISLQGKCNDYFMQQCAHGCNDNAWFIDKF